MHEALVPRAIKLQDKTSCMGIGLGPSNAHIEAGLGPSRANRGHLLQKLSQGPFEVEVFPRVVLLIEILIIADNVLIGYIIERLALVDEVVGHSVSEALRVLLRALEPLCSRATGSP